jgi:hypothetical protein
MAPNSLVTFIDCVLETMNDTSSNDIENQPAASSYSRGCIDSCLLDDNSTKKSKRRQASLLTSPSSGKQERQNKSQRKSVHFNAYDAIAEVAHINDFSKKKINRIWYSYDEQRATLNICIDLVKRFDMGEDLRHEEMLGLRKRTRENLKALKETRRAGADAVFALQGIQNEQDGVLLSEQIARLYKKIAAESELDAHKLALQLAAEVVLQ